MFYSQRKPRLPTADEALPGRATGLPVPETHAVLGHGMGPAFPQHLAFGLFGLGCFWGAERRFWQAPGVWSTQVGYAAGSTPNPTYREVCTGQTGHNEVVRVLWDPAQTSFEALLTTFWESHDPTQGMRQGNDVGTQYRSGVYTFGEAQQAAALRSREVFQRALTEAGHPEITTEVLPAPAFYYAEEYHQQYLHKNVGGYCGLGGTGVSCPTGIASA